MEFQDSPKDRRTYYSERERLKTYHKWTNSYDVLPQKLAKNGFIHTGPNDTVMCVFCYGSLSKSEKGNDVEKKDANCSCEREFVKGDHGKKSKPISSELNPLIPAFVDEVTRFETYEYWPSTNNQNPKTLAAAGFFYQPLPGKNDRVQCFTCGKCLHGWESDDDPWRKHSRKSRKCKFVLTMTSQEFVDECFREEAALQHTSVQTVLKENGSDYSEEQVFRAFQKLSSLKGSADSITADQLRETLDEDEG